MRARQHTLSGLTSAITPPQPSARPSSGPCTYDIGMTALTATPFAFHVWEETETLARSFTCEAPNLSSLAAGEAGTEGTVHAPRSALPVADPGCRGMPCT